MIIFKPAKRKKLRKNAVATPSNSALRNLFPTNNQLIKKNQNEKKLLSTAPTHGHARPPNAKPVRRGRTQRGGNLTGSLIEKLSLLPDAKAQLKYLRSSTSKKLSITYIEKIIRNFQLFVLEEDGSFSPEELNPVKKKEKKTAKSDRANDVADAKNDENRQKTAEEKTENSNEKHSNFLFLYQHRIFRECVTEWVIPAYPISSKSSPVDNLSNRHSNLTLPCLAGDGISFFVVCYLPTTFPSVSLTRNVQPPSLFPIFVLLYIT